MAECIHFPDDPNAVCSICKPKPKIELDAWGTENVGIKAKYHGTCVECGATIYEDDDIVWAGGGWKHVNCRG